ncbi:3-hydroxyacyl-CoA dehydrogenase family protein [Bacillus inaquosorum]|uniref:3-hydroxybutyryl-CoA dehydrogenase n=1 Tax=Bacillus inaquosorum KCTC 13429 TaxID=1236548 RepID=A0A9W5PCC2_9BACI|nr:MULTISPECIES: 3-hydroxyacyl-CoA dehydrogenase family protein [Bacillus]MDZ5722642.1 3-hydroxyacyl-CoA dehydrogenase family protein [Bacillus sp. SXabc123]PSI03588.1 3-hydroxyacyl-CoA dehydrogenase family protein [Bacillus subtilis]AWM16018.1 3-hydroxyacyl-CoA dehydrogenase family protein [Bacillus inaquosorum]ELS60617.1 3-hydroxybutyryl-CoA dehydrogenase [Bacillus inaquosorum KCTC 13429]MCY7759953.1 3-hydroxyacyl-CoA dehydrogenase family protein [Bacillus inaquosorum]
MDFRTAGVIGGGVMGADMALDLSANGYQVILLDISDEKLKAAEENIKKTFRLVQLMRKEKFSMSLEDVLDNIQFTTEPHNVEPADIIIENVTEDWEIKRQVYLQLKDICREDTIYLVNTSCISITKVGSLMHRPEKVIGAHFMNPVPLKELVEVIRGDATTDETVNATVEFLKSFDKNPVVVHDLPGFVSNRVLMLTINESIWTVQDQVATPANVDKIFRGGFGHKMGPLATADLIGLDTILNSLLVLYESYKDSKFRPCPLLVKMVDAGKLGRKSGQGFFQYS